MRARALLTTKYECLPVCGRHQQQQQLTSKPFLGVHCRWQSFHRTWSAWCRPCSRHPPPPVACSSRRSSVDSVPSAHSIVARPTNHLWFWASWWLRLQKEQKTEWVREWKEKVIWLISVCVCVCVLVLVSSSSVLLQCSHNCKSLSLSISFYRFVPVIIYFVISFSIDDCTIVSKSNFVVARSLVRISEHLTLVCVCVCAFRPRLTVRIHDATHTHTHKHRYTSIAYKARERVMEREIAAAGE